MNPTNVNPSAGAIPKTVAPALARYPSWMDQPYQLATVRASELERVTIGANGVGMIRGNPRRWALYIVTGSGAPFTSAQPYPVQAGFDFAAPAAQPGHLKFTIFEYGPLVAAEWYVRGAPGVVFGFLELEVF